MRSASSHLGNGSSPEHPGVKVASDDANPTLRRRELGFLLRKLRTDRGLTLDEVAEYLLVSPTKISRLETGRTGASARDIRDLANLFQITDQAERERLMTLAREGKQRAWWQQYSLPYATYVGLEAEATSISDYNSGIISGLLQTEEYARAMFGTAVPPLDRATLEQRVEARTKRQKLLMQDNGPLFHCILDEAALRRHVGGPSVMKAQLEHLIGAADLPSVTLQLIPLEAGAHPGMANAFNILEFTEGAINDLVYIESFYGRMYLESAADLDLHKQLFSRLRSIALSPGRTTTLIARIATTYN
jgi:transcriptional regulator with XRE-family HTH domain